MKMKTNWGDLTPEMMLQLNNTDNLPMRILRSANGIYTLGAEEAHLLGVASGKLATRLLEEDNALCVGDWVLVEPSSGDGQVRILDLLPRKTTLRRRHAGAGVKLQYMASNIDTICICTSANRDLNLRRVERFLTIARGSGADVLIVLTKADLDSDPTATANALQSQFADVPVIPVDYSEGGYDGLRHILKPGKTYALAGSSGVGKSTLINGLIGTEMMRTHGVREDDKGRHTTTHRELLRSPDGVFFIDMPGIREVQLYDDSQGLDMAFGEIVGLSEQCKFNDCRHESEPGCAVRRAIETGELEEERLLNYRKMQREMDLYWKKKGRERFKSSRKKNTHKK